MMKDGEDVACGSQSRRMFSRIAQTAGIIKSHLPLSETLVEGNQTRLNYYALEISDAVGE